jgi:flagellar biogenesis protein FliO
MTVLATAGQTWGGETVALVAAVGFVGFAVWIVVQRLRHGRADADGPGERRAEDE